MPVRGTEVDARALPQVLGILLVAHGQHGGDDQGDDERDAEGDGAQVPAGGLVRAAGGHHDGHDAGDDAHQQGENQRRLHRSPRFARSSRCFLRHVMPSCWFRPCAYVLQGVERGRLLVYGLRPAWRASCR